MEFSGESISARVARLNAEIVGKSSKKACSILTREGLLDSLQALYDECCIENLQKTDKNIEFFVESYKSTMSNLRQTRVNKSDFEIKNVIGRGHFGDVHVVIEKQTRDIYAMKSIRKCDSLDQTKTSFIEERNIMAFSESPWLTTLFYAFQDITHLFFVMEYHPGGDLLGLLYRQGGTLPESAATFYVAEIVLGLKDLHNMGYVHRDIKPDNILLDRCGHIKLADFGSAAKLTSEGYVVDGPPVGTPDYIAPEILMTMEGNKNQNMKYGVSCDLWSLGILAYELTLGVPPFTGENTPSLYAKIMNHSKHLKFPSDALLSQAYVNFIRSLIVDQSNRLKLEEVFVHPLFKNVNFDTIRDQVPPFVPKITAEGDTSNFTELPKRKKPPCIDNFKKKTEFSGRNLPFVGFTYTPNLDEAAMRERVSVKNEAVQNLKAENFSLRKKLAKNESCALEKDGLAKKLEEKSRKLENVEQARCALEREVANNVAECAALKRTLELERKERSELEKRALDLIKSAKTKWETEEKRKIESLTSEIQTLKEKLSENVTNNKILEEQLKIAVKNEVHKQSMAQVEKFSRRSVIGLESRLDKVTLETQSTIYDLNKKLNDEVHLKNQLENQLLVSKDKERELTNRLKNSENEYNKLQGKIEESEKLVKTLLEKVNLLEEETKAIEDLQEENVVLKERVNSSKKTIKDLENKYTLLEMELEVTESLKSEIQRLNTKIKSMQSELNKLREIDVELSKEQEKYNLLKNQLEQRETNFEETQELKELRSKYWRIEKDFNNCKIDKRILERELKESENKNKELTKEIDDLKQKIAENKKHHESALLELSSMNDSLSVEVIKAKESAKTLEEKLKSEKKLFEEAKIVIGELKCSSNNKEDKIRQMAAEIGKLRTCLNKLEDEKKGMSAESEILLKKKMDFENELQKAKLDVQNSKLNLAALREACTLLENQVVEYEKINDSLTKKQNELHRNTEKLIADLQDAKKEAQDAKKKTNEEISQRFLAETKIKKLSDEIDSLTSENRSYKDQVMEYKRYSNELSEELTSAEEKIGDFEVAVKSMERQIENLYDENQHLKEELSNYITQLHQVREANYKLNQQVSELKGVRNVLEQRVEELDALLTEKSIYYKDREIKSTATISQQIKLIDYLQTKIDESQKKKTLTDKLFGHSKKENLPPFSMPMNYKDLEEQLQKERIANKALQEEIYGLKAARGAKINDENHKQITKIERIKSHDKHSEVMSPRTKKAVEKLVQSPSKAMTKQKSVQRMHHNIPHRFESRLCTKPQKCVKCNNLIMIGRNMCSCRDCHVNVHTNCASSMPSSCGLPHAFTEHFKNVVEDENTIEIKTDSDVSVESWIKIPNASNSWKKCYAVLSGELIKIYDDSPVNNGNVEPVSVFELRPADSHGKVILEPLFSEIEVPVAKSDLPFLLKVEVSPHMTCWPPKCFTMLALSLQDKEMWSKAFQAIYREDPSKLIETKIEIPDGLIPNAALDLNDEMIAIGTSKGLHVHYQNTLLKIDGPNEVHLMDMFDYTKAVLMIAERNRNLVVVDANHLMNVTQCTAATTKPPLKCKTISVRGLNGFHMLEAQRGSVNRIFCVATPKQLVIMGYDENDRIYLPFRVLDTAEPTSTVLFTEHSILVGADKFFEIDSATFQAEEFLDTSDPELIKAQKCYKLKSFPLSIVQVKRNQKEYLAVFNEFSIFVDEYGRPSRKKEWESNHLPLAVVYAEPYLFVVQFAAVEIYRMSDGICNEEAEVTETVRIKLDKFQYLGASYRKGIYVWHEGKVKFLDGKNLLPTDDSTISNESDRFSFTSSVVRSLDGGSSVNDSPVMESKPKTVSFVQTSF